MLFPALRWMSWASTVLPLTVMSSLAMTAAVFPAVIRLPLVSSVTVSAWSFHPVLPRLILIPTALFLLMALSVFRFFCMSLAFIPACTAYRAFSRPSPTSPALFTGAAMSLAALTAVPPKDTVRPLFLYSIFYKESKASFMLSGLNSSLIHRLG